MIQILTIILVAISLVFISFLVKITIRRANALNERIEEYHEDQEELAKKPGPINPYADLETLFNNESDTSGKDKRT